jgi:DNA-binding NtrC family response regulator
MRKMLDLIAKVGRSDVSVLIQGESGTGKELVARAIYDLNPQGEFVPIDCGALAVNLVESELFGHEKGAFTGAAGPRKGLLESAHGGTAFFDEVGELPAEIQSKLLRVLQQREIRPLGANRARPSSFRVVAATNRNLTEEVANGRFRLDLYYRLNVVTLVIPPLRERKADIPILVEHFLRQAGRRYRLGPNLMEALLDHAWPGNVRELQNCVARLVALTSDDCLNAADLPFPLPKSSSQVTFPLRPSPPSWQEQTPQRSSERIGPTVRDAEQQAISKALACSNGKMAEAAKALGIGRTTLYRRLKELKLEETGGWVGSDGNSDTPGSIPRSELGGNDRLATMFSTIGPLEVSVWGGMRNQNKFYELLPKPLTSLSELRYAPATWAYRMMTPSVAPPAPRPSIGASVSLFATA